MRSPPVVPSDRDGRPDVRALRHARGMPDAIHPIEIVGGGSLGSVLADCCERMGFSTRVIDPDTWELRNAANSFAVPGQPKGDLVMRVQDAPAAPCLIRVLATDNLESRSYAALVRQDPPLVGYVDVRTGPNQVTVAMLPTLIPREAAEMMGYHDREDSVPEMGCADRGSMPQTLMACAPASWAIMQMLRAYESMCMWRISYGKMDLILKDDGSSERVFVPLRVRRPAVSHNGEAFNAEEWEAIGMPIFRSSPPEILEWAQDSDPVVEALSESGSASIRMRFEGGIGPGVSINTNDGASLREAVRICMMGAEAIDYGTFRAP